ncbi:putative sensor (PAS) domain for methyl-accepting chemotaxis sensory transducer [hydrothermal vent metagenome]|uniref:Putative sensor (PAS) domain for methyl-accepting chemotaxis sensory transducer n=1 Tax=hydrothermal vent metagenome TaxID=652676 RepID=A0A3B0RXV7_9ZZZZ
MTIYSVTPVNEEITFGKEEIIVSKTDLKGKLTYTNDVFCRVAEMTTREVIGQPHNIIRHPDMPRAVFKLLWDAITAGSEIFAYVKNMSKTGKYYWVFAHVTPSFDNSGNVDGYHSNRRYPQAQKIDVISKIYRSLLEEEAKHANAKAGLEASMSLFKGMMAEQDKNYSEFIWSLRG